MTHNQNSKLTDFVNQEDPSSKENQEDPSSKENQEDPSSNETHLCDCYTEEKSRAIWEKLKSHENLTLYEPACGHAIDYLIKSLRPMVDANSAREPELSPKSARIYSNALKTYIEWLHQEQNKRVVDAELDRTEEDDIEEYFNQRSLHKVGVQTLEIDRTAIKNLYKHIDPNRDAELNFNYANITEVIDPSAYDVTDRQTGTALTKEELEDLFNAAESQRNKLMMIAGAEWGSRNVDLRKIKLDDVDLENKVVHLRDTKNSEVYSLPITDEFVLLLKDWRNRGRPAMDLNGSSEYLFPSQDVNNDYLSGEQLLQIVHDCAKRAGIQDVIGQMPKSAKPHEHDSPEDVEMMNKYKVNVHTLRHTFCHLLDEQDVPDDVLREALNHDNLESTQIYRDNQEKYQRILQDLFSNISLAL